MSVVELLDRHFEISILAVIVIVVAVADAWSDRRK